MRVNRLREIHSGKGAKSILVGILRREARVEFEDGDGVKGEGME
jgi:hypothetical protein